MSTQPKQSDHRGGNEPPATVNERPEQNIGYDEAVKGAPLTPDERAEAVADSPLTGDEESKREKSDR